MATTGEGNLNHPESNLTDGVKHETVKDDMETKDEASKASVPQTANTQELNNLKEKSAHPQEKPCNPQDDDVSNTDRSPSDEVFSESISSKDDLQAMLSKSDSVSSSLSSQTISADDSERPLIAAAREFDFKTIKELLKSDDINVNQTSKKGYTALHEMIKCYIKMDIVDKMSNRKHLEELIVSLREKSLDVNAVDHGKKKQTALHIIAEHDGNDDVIKILLAVGMRVNLTNAGGETALHKAVTKVAAVNAEALLQGGADPDVQDNRGLTALHRAATGPRHLGLLQLLLKCGANTELADRGGRLPLHVAAKAGRADLVRELLIGGATINSLDMSGQTPLHLAAAHDVTGTVLREILDRPSVKLNERDAVYGETALHKIVRFQRMESLKLLAQKKIKVNTRDHSGNTALHKASHCHNIMLWKTLLSLNADITALNNNQLTPEQLAIKAKNHVALAMINQFNNIEE